MLERYVQAALDRSTCEFLDEDSVYYCEIPELPGVWSSGATAEEARGELRSVIEDWVRLGLKLSHHIPVLSGIDLNSQHLQLT